MEQIPAKTIVQRTKSSEWFGTDYNMNIYRGCPHGCIYCDSRSECYGTEDFDRVRVKANALETIRDDLRRRIKPGVVATGSMSDPYNSHEKEMQLSRHALELLSAYGFGVSIATKSDLVLRDIDVLKEIREHSPVIVKLTITTPHDELSLKLEPHAPSSTRRLEVLRELSENGVFCGVLMMPVLPFIEDDPADITELVRLASQAGARFVSPAFGVTLRQNQRTYFLEKIDALFPGMSGRYISRFGTDYSCRCPNAKQLWNAFKAECDKTGILCKMPDIISGYKMGYGDMQLSFFEV